jgi:hypothetical protein
MASARTDAATFDVVLVPATVAESLNRLPDIIADAALDGSARVSNRSSIAATGIVTSAA